MARPRFRFRPQSDFSLEARPLLSIGLPGDGVLDLTFVSDRYTDFDRFHLHVDDAVESLFQIEPYKSRRGQFAIHTLDNSISLGSGLTTSGNTNRDGMTVDWNAAAQVVVDHGIPTDFVIVLSDIVYFGGAALEGTNVAVLAGGAAYSRVTPHELSHLVGGLADEYLYATALDQPLDGQVHENLFAGELADSPWDDLVAPDEYGLGGGAYANWYRSSLRSLMSDANDPALNPVSQRLVSAGLDYWAGPMSDTQPPIVAFGNLHDGQSVAGPVPVTVNVSDNLGVAWTQLWVDGALARTATIAPFTLDWKTEGLALGPHRLQVRAFDTSGNVAGTSEITAHLTRGSNFEIVAPASGTTLSLGFSQSFDVSAAGWYGEIGEFQIYVGERLVAYTPYPVDLSLPVAYGSLRPGQNVVTAVALGVDGTSELYRRSIEIIRADLEPLYVGMETVFWDPLQGVVDIPVAIGNRRPSSVEFQVDGVTIATDTSYPFSFTLDTRAYPNGTHELGLYAKGVDETDVAGYIEIVEFRNGAAGPPRVAFSTPRANQTVRGSLRVDALIRSGVARTVKLYVDNRLAGTASRSPFTFLVNTRSWSDGAHTLKLVATGPAGSTQTTQRVVFANARDRTPPRITLRSPNRPVTVGAAGLPIVGRVTDNVGVARVEVIIDGRLMETSTSPAFRFDQTIARLSRGIHQLRIRAVDTAGNVAQSRSIRITKNA